MYSLAFSQNVSVHLKTKLIDAITFDLPNKVIHELFYLLNSVTLFTL